jgi:hypothetical protein
MMLGIFGHGWAKFKFGSRLVADVCQFCPRSWCSVLPHVLYGQLDRYDLDAANCGYIAHRSQKVRQNAHILKPFINIHGLS